MALPGLVSAGESPKPNEMSIKSFKNFAALFPAVPARGSKLRLVRPESSVSARYTTARSLWVREGAQAWTGSGLGIVAYPAIFTPSPEKSARRIGRGHRRRARPTAGRGVPAQGTAAVSRAAWIDRKRRPSSAHFRPLLPSDSRGDFSQRRLNFFSIPPCFPTLRRVRRLDENRWKFALRNDIAWF